MIKIHTFYNATVCMPEFNNSATKTDASFYEPLNVLVQKIIRGEKVKMSSLDSYEFVDIDKVSDDVFDGTSSDAGVDDLAELDSFMFSSKYKQNLNKKGEAQRASDAPSIASASDASKPEQKDFVEKAEV